jgi:ankyrin repeat protein
MRKLFLMLAIFAFAGEGLAKELKDVRINYNKLKCQRLYYGIYMVPSPDRKKNLGQLLVAKMVLKAASLSLELEVKVEPKHVAVDYGIGMFGKINDFSLVCTKNIFLTPESAKVKERGDADEKIREVVFEDGMMKYEKNGKKIEEKFPKDSVSTINLFRVIPQLPKKKGVRYEFDNMFNLSGGDIEKPAEGKRFAIVYAGKETIELDGTKVKYDRYDLVDVSQPSSFYANRKGLVQCVKSEQAIMKLLTKDEVVKLKEKRKEQAKAAAEKRVKMLQNIHGVIRVGDNDDIKRLLDKDPALVNKKDNRQETPLHKAIKYKKLDAVKLLLDRGADITTVDKNGKGVLDMARDVDTTRLLLDKAPELVKQTNQWDQTPLHDAVRNGKEELVKLYIEKGADVNAVEKSGYSPLLFGASKNLSIYKALVEAGADVNAKTSYGWTLLYVIAGKGRLETFKYLVSKGADIQAVTVNGKRTVLHRATDGPTAEFILEKAPHLINQKDIHGRTPLFDVARDSKSDDAVKVLLSKGTDINAVNDDGNTVLHDATKYGQLEVVKCLLANGANISALRKNGETVVHRAKKPEIMEYLLSQKPELANIKDKNGRTPLLTIATMGGVESAKILLKHGADINAKDRRRSSALDLAVKSKQSKIIELLKKHGAVRGVGN